MEDLSFLGKRNNKAFSEKTRKEFQDTISPDETITFYSLFDSTCQPDRLLVLKEKDGGTLSMSLINFLRGILNLFKVRPTSKIIYFLLANIATKSNLIYNTFNDSTHLIRAIGSSHTHYSQWSESSPRSGSSP